jgi:hypothetical protein
MSEGRPIKLRSLDQALADLRAKCASTPEDSRSRIELEKMIRDLEREIADRQGNKSQQ